MGAHHSGKPGVPPAPIPFFHPDLCIDDLVCCWFAPGVCDPPWPPPPLPSHPGLGPIFPPPPPSFYPPLQSPPPHSCTPTFLLLTFLTSCLFSPPSLPRPPSPPYLHTTSPFFPSLFPQTCATSLWPLFLLFFVKTPNPIPLPFPCYLPNPPRLRPLLTVSFFSCPTFSLVFPGPHTLLSLLLFRPPPPPFSCLSTLLLVVLSHRPPPPATHTPNVTPPPFPPLWFPPSF
jgi:hypothetical protein